MLSGSQLFHLTGVSAIFDDASECAHEERSSECDMTRTDSTLGDRQSMISETYDVEMCIEVETNSRGSLSL